MQTNVDLNRNMIGKDAKIWLIERILGTKLSSRDDKALQINIVNSTLLILAAAETSTITMGDLI